MCIKRERLNDGATVKVWSSKGMKQGEMVVVGKGRKSDSERKGV